VVFGVAWVWLGTSEAPTPAVLGGGALVLGALVFNEAAALRGARRAGA
jgi:drug/metabolite transporter (DMT)-like permease